jgi:hypothetical protein
MAEDRTSSPVWSPFIQTSISARWEDFAATLQPVADDDDLDIKPVKKKVALKPRSKSAPPRFQVANRVVKMLALAVGAFVSIVGWMSIFGLVLDNGIVRFVLALLPTLGLGLVIVDRVLKRFNVDDRGGAMLDVYAVFLMVQALLFVVLGGVTHGAFTKEGDRYAKSGSRGMARVAYLLGGKSPAFPDEPLGASGAASTSASAAAASDAGKAAH